MEQARKGSSTYSPPLPDEVVVMACPLSAHIPVWDAYEPDSSITIVHDQSRRKLGDRLSERILMPPPTLPPPLARQRPPAQSSLRPNATSLPTIQPRKSTMLSPVQFVSNSVRVMGRAEESPREGTVKYDTVKYRYKSPNYVVTDVPDLWSNSKMEVVEENGSHSPSAMAETKTTESTNTELFVSGAIAVLSADRLESGIEQKNDTFISVADIHALSKKSGRLSSKFGNLEPPSPVVNDGTNVTIHMAYKPNESSVADNDIDVLAILDESTGSSKRATEKMSQLRKVRAESVESVVSSSTDGGVAMDWLVTSIQGGEEQKGKRRKKSRDKSRSEKSDGNRSSSKKKKKKKETHSKDDASTKEKKKRWSEKSQENSTGGNEGDPGMIGSKDKKSSLRDSDTRERRKRGSTSIRTQDDKRPRKSEESPRRRSPFVDRSGKRLNPLKAALDNREDGRYRSPSYRARSSSTSRRGSIGLAENIKERSPARDRRSTSRSDRRSPDRDRGNISRTIDRSSSASTSRRREPSETKHVSGKSPASKDLEKTPSRGQPSVSRSKCDPAKDVVVTDILDLIEQHLTKEDGQLSDDSDNDDVASISNMSLFGKPSIIDKRSKKIEINLHMRHKRRESAKERRSSVGGGDRRKERCGSLSRKAPDLAIRKRRQSLSPQRRHRSLERSHRRSGSPDRSRASRRRDSFPARNRRHRASSYDTIRSSQLDYPMLRKMAVENAIELRRKGIIPPQYAMSAEERAIWRSGGKTLDDLTALCKRMAQRERKHGGREDDDDRSSVASDLPTVNHPYRVRDRVISQEIGMNIRDGRNLPLRSGQERAVQNLPLRQLYPVSSGSSHRDLTWQPVEPEREMRPRELKPREKVKDDKKGSRKEEGPEDQPMTLERQLANQLPPPDYRIPVSFSDKLRLLKFQRELATNPDNPEVLSQMQETHQQMMEWANQFQYRGAPGQFTGQTTAAAVPLYQPWDKQAWVRKDQLLHLTPVGGKGQYLLQKMGWVIGQAIGLRNKGVLEPVKMEIKLNKRGLQAAGERGDQPVFRNGVKTVNFGGCPKMHPCSALNEACTKRGWGTPAFDLVKEEGNVHTRTFMFKVKINGVDYRPTVTGSSKKLAKAEVANWCLNALGLVGS